MSIAIPEIQQFFLALTRVLAVLSQVPVLGGNAIPMEVRIVFGIFITTALLPWQPLPPEAQALSIFPFFYSIASELFIGLMVGFVVTLTLTSLQIAGEMIGTNTGFNSGRVFNPAFGEGASPIDQLFLMLSLMFFVTVNGHHLLLVAIQRTFTVVPLNTTLPTIPLERAVEVARDLINAGIQLSLPAVGALIMADIAMGLLSKVAPQIQVFFIGIPFKIVLGLLTVTITLSLYYPVILDMLNRIGERMLYVLGA